MKVIKLSLIIYNLAKVKKLQELFKKYNSSSKANHPLINLIEKQYDECHKVGEKRMNLANESYFMIENEIKRINLLIEKLKFEHDNLESNYFSFNNYLINKNFEEIFNFENNLNSKRRSKGKKLLNESEIFSAFSPSINKKLKKKLKNKKFLKNKRLNSAIKNQIQNDNSENENNININNNNDMSENQKKKILETGEGGWEDVTYKELDGKIGPKEPVYCFCNYISYGNMIKCDNPGCKREWFHFHCVGLKNQPKGKWFCSEKCAKEYMKKNSHNDKNNKKNEIKKKKK